MDIHSAIDSILPSLPGWCTPHKGRTMAGFILAEKPVTCVELGVFGGRSLVAMALALKSNGVGKAYGVDPYIAAASLEGKNDPANDEWWSHLDYEGIYQAAVGGIRRAEVEGFAEIIRARSQDVADKWAQIDLLHQDSNHSEEVSCAEVEIFAPKLKSGGLWIMDDVDWETTRKALGTLVSRGFDVVHRDAGWMILRKPA